MWWLTDRSTIEENRNGSSAECYDVKQPQSCSILTFENCLTTFKIDRIIPPLRITTPLPLTECGMVTLYFSPIITSAWECSCWNYKDRFSFDLINCLAQSAGLKSLLEWNVARLGTTISFHRNPPSKHIPTKTPCSTGNRNLPILHFVVVVFTREEENI